MRIINKSHSFMAYAILATLALTCVFTITGPSQVMADGSGSNASLPDTVPVGGGGDTTGHGSSIESNTYLPATLDILLLILDAAVLGN